MSIGIKMTVKEREKWGRGLRTEGKYKRGAEAYISKYNRPKKKSAEDAAGTVGAARRRARKKSKGVKLGVLTEHPDYAGRWFNKQADPKSR